MNASELAADIKQEIFLARLTSIWAKLEPEVQASILILAENSLFKPFPPAVHLEGEANNQTWTN